MSRGEVSDFRNEVNVPALRHDLLDMLG